MKSRLILVGGFLGAGKTTLLWEAAQRLARQNRRVGLITNDQAPELVDTALLSRENMPVAEVSGSCFCCNFPGLLNAMSKLQSEAKADVLIAEPVGSCTDLSATIVQPLKEQLQNELTVAPLSVLVDPVRLNDILSGGTAGLHRSAAYIYRKQIEEADVLVINKSDMLSADEMEHLTSRAAENYPLARVFALSAQTGDGLDAWLEYVTQNSDSGLQITDVDYDTYAEGEAVLGWLNATFRLQGPATNWDELATTLMKKLSQRFDAMGAAVGHVKLMIEAGSDFTVANLTGTGETLMFRKSGTVSSLARMTLNARVEMSPEALENIVHEVMAYSLKDGQSAEQLAWKCLSPGRPEPTHRFDYVVSVR